jgi:hypothetical protein
MAEHCEGCASTALSLQRSPTSGSEPMKAPPIVGDVLRSPGQPLDRATRAFFELRFGHDFNRVRIHTDSQAAESARAINALAYTVGRDVVFGAGGFDPSTDCGKRLLAHELAHTIQQDRGIQRKDHSISLAAPSDSSEYEADASAEAVMQGRLPKIVAQNAFRIDRKPCLPASFCKSRIPGSEGDFRKAVEESQEVETESVKSSGEAARAKPAIQLTKYAKKNLPDLMASLTGINVSPVIAKLLSAQFIPLVSESGIATKALGHIEVPSHLEDEAAEYNTTQVSNIGGYTRLDWETNIAAILTHEVSHGRFTAETPKGLRGRGESSLTELEELDAILSEFPIAYRHTMNSSDSAGEKKEKLRKYITARVENKDEGIRGILHKLRCLLPCEKVTKSVRVVFSRQAETWDDQMKSAILAELNSLLEDWPVSISPTSSGGRKSVNSTIEVFEFIAEIYQDLLKADRPSIGKAELSHHLKEWMNDLVHAVIIIRSELSNDTALMMELRIEYTAAVQSAVAATAKALKLSSQELYESNRSLIYEWALPEANADATPGASPACEARKTSTKYGCYCGRGTSCTSGLTCKPVDALDACCQAHDICYTASGCEFNDRVNPFSSKHSAARACDSSLCSCARGLTLDGPAATFRKHMLAVFG